MKYAKDVNWPQPPVLEDRQHRLHGKTLAIVHVRLGRVISKDSIHHDDFLATLSSAGDLIVARASTYRSLNQPVGRNQAFVCVGPGGIMKKEAMPTPSVRAPSMRNR